MCNCKSWVRTFNETKKGIPLSDHHPHCEDYKLINYANVSYGNEGGLIMEHSMIEEFLRIEVENGNDAEDYSVTDIEITEDQYKNLPEHEGF